MCRIWGETQRVGDIRILVVRPVEAVVALQALNKAYYHYSGAVADYNRPNSGSYRALGNPAQALAVDEQPLSPPTATTTPPHSPNAVEEVPPPPGRPGQP